MKKIYAFISALFVAGFFVAQTIQPNFAVEMPKNIKQVLASSIQPSKEKVQGVSSFWIDYHGAELSEFGAASPSTQATPTGPGVRVLPWAFNAVYDGKTTSSEYASFGSSIFRYFIVGFDSIYDTQTAVGYDANQISSIRIDTIEIQLGHENNSASKDTFKISIINLANTMYMKHYPGSTVYQSYIITTDTSLSSSSQSYLEPVRLSLPVGFNLGNGVKKFGIKVEYMGDKLDTCALSVGFRDEGGTGTGINQCRFKPMESKFAHLPVIAAQVNNGSTYAWNDFLIEITKGNPNPFTSFVPSLGVGNSYTECDNSGVGGSSTIGDGKSLIQNALISAKVTVGIVGVEELKKNGVYLGQNSPNPFNGTTTINYQLADNKNVNLEVFNITGKKVMSIEEGFKATGKHTVTINSSELNAGVYFYTLTAGDVRVTKRMTIVE